MKKFIKIIMVVTIIISLSASTTFADSEEYIKEIIEVDGPHIFEIKEEEPIIIRASDIFIDKNYLNKFLKHTFTNLNNFGFVDENDNCIYYTNFYENESLCQIEGEYNELLSDRERVYGINYYNNKLYFGCFNEDKKCMQLCCINKDGTDFEELIDDIGNDIYVVDYYVYYTMLPYYKLYRLDLLTGETEQLIKKRTEYINIVNKKLYYVNKKNIIEYDLDTKEEKILNTEKGIAHLQYYYNNLYYCCEEGIRKINLDTYEVQKVFENKDELKVRGLIAADEYIFFLGYTYDKENKTENQFVYRITHDGSNLTQIYNEENISKINIIKDKIFITNDNYAESDENKFIKVINFEGKEFNWQLEHVLIDEYREYNIDYAVIERIGGEDEFYKWRDITESKYETSTNLKKYFNVHEDIFINLANYGFVSEYENWIYYTNFYDDGLLFKIDKKGKNTCSLADRKQTYGINFYKNKLYFGCFNEEKECMQLCSINKDGSDFEELIDNIGNDIYVVDDYIYYTILPDYKLFKQSLSTGETEQLSNKQAEYINIINDKVYYVNKNNIIEYDLNTKEEKILTTEKGTAHLQYYNDFIYYCCEKGIMKINLFTYEVQKVFENKDVLKVRGLTAEDEYIFFLGYNYDEENKTETQFVYRITHDGRNSTQIYNKENISKINILKDKIFITNDNYAENKESKFFKIIDFEGNEISAKH